MGVVNQAREFIEITDYGGKTGTDIKCCDSDIIWPFVLLHDF